MLASLGAFAIDTTDKLYATNVRIDSYDQSLYVNICLEGSRRYIAYGTDVLLPTGLVAVKKGDGPNVVMIDDEYQIDEEIIYPYEEGRKGNTYYHTVYSSFPDKNQHHVRVGCLHSKFLNFTANSGALFRIYVESEYEEGAWPIGAIKVYDAELNEIDQHYESPATETIVPIHTGETTLPLKISATAKWSTCVLPFATSIPEGVKAYVCERNDEQNIYLTEVAEQLNSYTPYILYAENGFDGNVSGTISADETPEKGVVANGYLNGAIIPQTATNGYILQKQNGVVKFYAIGSEDSFNIPAGKCWMTLPESVKAKSLGFKIETASGIEDVKAEESELIFDLLGRQRQEGEKGILIKNGKKILSL